MCGPFVSLWTLRVQGTDSMEGYGVPHHPEAPLLSRNIFLCLLVRQWGPFQSHSRLPLCGPRKYLL